VKQSLKNNPVYSTYIAQHHTDFVQNYSQQELIMACEAIEDIMDFEEPVTAEGIELKRTYRPSLIKRKRQNGFLRRIRSKSGRFVLARKATKGRIRRAV